MKKTAGRGNRRRHPCFARFVVPRRDLSDSGRARDHFLVPVALEWSLGSALLKPAGLGIIFRPLRGGKWRANGEVQAGRGNRTVARYRNPTARSIGGETEVSPPIGRQELLSMAPWSPLPSRKVPSGETTVSPEPLSWVRFNISQGKINSG